MKTVEPSCPLGVRACRETAKPPALQPCIRAFIEEAYARYHHRAFVHPDPLELLYRYEDPRDREVAGMIASSLAFGRVEQIVRSAASVLDRMGKPRAFVENTSRAKLGTTFAGFRHRFVTGRELTELLCSMQRVLRQWGSLEALFRSLVQTEDTSVLPALCSFVSVLSEGSAIDANYLLPKPERGSACKRLHLFLRWMVRSDEVDPGGWQYICASKLVCPVDTHMLRIGRALGLTARKQADIRCAVEITSGLRLVNRDDPVRFDFSLTRLGIRRTVEARGHPGDDARESCPHIGR